MLLRLCKPRLQEAHCSRLRCYSSSGKHFKADRGRAPFLAKSAANSRASSGIVTLDRPVTAAQRGMMRAEHRRRRAVRNVALVLTAQPGLALDQALKR